MAKRVLVAFDFDHTLINKNSDTYILRLLPNGTDLPQSIRKLYSTAGWNDYQREVFRYLHSCHVTKDQLLSCVAEMPMVKGMRELLEYLVKFKMMVAKDEVGVRDTVNGVVHANIAENGVVPMQQQHSGVESAAGSHSVVDGKNASDSPVQFDIIILSDANTVSTCQSVWLSALTCRHHHYHRECGFIMHSDISVCMSVCSALTS